MRHAAIVGSTGAGKTSAVASLLQGILGGGWPSANVVVIDPHGEYGRAVGESGSVRSVLGKGDSALRVPYWALPAEQILRAFIGGPAGGGALKRFEQLVTDERKAFVKQSTWLALDDAAVTADTPVPFDINSVWHALDRENNETRDVKADPKTACLVDAGDPVTLKSAKFKPHGGGSTPPHQSGTYGAYSRTPDLLRLGLKDPRLQFFCGPKGDPKGSDPLEEVMLEWLGHSKPVSVLDFSGVPNDVADLAIGVVINLIFEAALRSKIDGIGRPRPVLLVLEEAHRYLGDDAADITREAANKIAREGRKYGIGLLLVTQRPSELPDTALAQCGTIISLRLTNSRDQGGIRAALPDAVSGLAEVLPSLRTGEALISGEAIVLPSRALIDLPDPEPDAQDPSLTPWREDPPKTPNLKPALNAWRGTYEK